MKQLTLIALVAVLLPALAFAGSIEMSVKDQAPGEEKKVADTDTDTYGNRLAAAQRYLDVVPMKNMMRDIINEYTKNLPENQRASFAQYMTEAIRTDVLERVGLASMAKHFTVKELDALATFYGSPEGRSVAKKFGAYMADVMPTIQQELLRAQKQIEGNVQ